VIIDSTIEARRPIVSAITPVGTSKTIWPMVKTLFTSIVSKRLRPPTLSRKIVLIAQISDAPNVKSPPRSR